MCKFNQNDAAIATISFDFNACGQTVVITHENYIASQIKVHHVVSIDGVLTNLMNPITLQCQLRLVLHSTTDFLMHIYN